MTMDEEAVSTMRVVAVEDLEGEPSDAQSKKYDFNYGKGRYRKRHSIGYP